MTAAPILAMSSRVFSRRLLTLVRERKMASTEAVI